MEGTPQFATYLRIVRRVDASTGLQTYTAYTRQEGKPWVRGGTWTHRLDAASIRIGLVSMGRPPEQPQHTADFDYVRVYTP